jgi:hypothetical protein
MSRKVVLLALCLPLLAIALGIVRAELQLQHARDFVFDIRGFDPLDLLRGRYLQFRLQLGEPSVREACDEKKGEICCLCLTPQGSGRPPQVERATCTTAHAACAGALPSAYTDAALRFYVAESHADALDKRLAQAVRENRAQAVLAIDKRGSVLVRELLLDGKPIPGGVQR